jgi:hypothetical protein
VFTFDLTEVSRQSRSHYLKSRHRVSRSALRGSFRVEVKRPGNYRRCSCFCPTVAYIMRTKPINLLEQIAEWRLEAADEDSGRYFYHINEVSVLERGERSYVIGRKGTGKTAICKYFETRIDYNRFCLKLSFKEFPFNLLYDLEDKAYTRPSQYVSLWKYFIYSSILSLMARNQNIDGEIRNKIEALYPFR